MLRKNKSIVKWVTPESCFLPESVKVASKVKQARQKIGRKTNTQHSAISRKYIVCSDLDTKFHFLSVISNICLTAFLDIFVLVSCHLPFPHLALHVFFVAACLYLSTNLSVLYVLKSPGPSVGLLFYIGRSRSYLNSWTWTLSCYPIWMHLPNTHRFSSLVKLQQHSAVRNLIYICVLLLISVQQDSSVSSLIMRFIRK